MTLNSGPSFHTLSHVHELWRENKPIRCLESHLISPRGGTKAGPFAEQLLNNLEVFGIGRGQSRLFRMPFENHGRVRRSGGRARLLRVGLEPRFRGALTCLPFLVRRFRASMGSLGGGSRRFRALSVSLPVLGRRFRAGRGGLGNRSRRFRAATGGRALTGRHLRACIGSGGMGSRHLRAPSGNMRVQGRRFRAWRVSPGKGSRHLRAAAGTLARLARNLRARRRHPEPQGRQFWHSNPTRSHELG